MERQEAVHQPRALLRFADVFPCGYYAGTGTTSEYKSAWHIGYALRDYMVAQGYMVMMPNRGSEVGYTDRIDTAYDWWTTKTNDRFIYVALHSNAGTSCGQQGGTQILAQSSYDSGLDASVGGGTGRVWQQLAVASPNSSSSLERVVTDRCTNQGYPSTVYEICTSKAVTMRTIYVESDYHSTTSGPTGSMTTTVRLHAAP